MILFADLVLRLALPARPAVQAQIREQLQNWGLGGWKPHAWEVPQALKPFPLVSNPLPQPHPS